MTASAISAASELPVPDDCHSKIRSIVRYWKFIHPEKGLPGRQHFDPLDIPELLPNVWLIDVLRHPMRFRIRLLGTRVVEYAGEDNTGKWVDQRWPNFDDSVFKHVVESCQPNWWRGPSGFRPEKDYCELERVRLPLARDGETVDMILCLTVFFDKSGTEIL